MSGYPKELGKKRLTRDRSPAESRASSRAKTARSFELLEPRIALAVDFSWGWILLAPVGGSDANGTTIGFTWSGGAPGARLSRLIIDTDPAGDGPSLGEVFFDTAPGGAGAGDSSPLAITRHDGFEVRAANVADGGSTLELLFAGFDPGERLELRIDLDAWGPLAAQALAQATSLDGAQFEATIEEPGLANITIRDSIHATSFPLSFASAKVSFPESTPGLSLPAERGTDISAPSLVISLDKSLVSIGHRAPARTWRLLTITVQRLRAEGADGDGANAVATARPRLDRVGWRGENLRDGLWTRRITADSELATPETVDEPFGKIDGIPFAGDFDGDGKDERGVFANGKWFIDANGNGLWDDEDLFVHWGKSGDRPITGDWDGDGKSELGIIRGASQTSPSNPAEGSALVGDFDGDGKDSVGVFHEGWWRFDLDGGGLDSGRRLTAREPWIPLGAQGDLPVVGDFDGDGVDEIGVFRDGKWLIDINGDRILDDRDLMFALGEAGDRPVVGDFDGDGRDDAAVYRSNVSTAQREVANR